MKCETEGDRAICTIESTGRANEGDSDAVGLTAPPQGGLIDAEDGGGLLD